MDPRFEILRDLWALFGSMNGFALRDYTHTDCPEWENPHGSSVAIPHERVFKFLGKENIDELVGDIEAVRRIASAFEQFARPIRLTARRAS